MTLKIALAGNPNCGKTTLFNDVTGSSQYVGNWPGVTVEKKEGRLRGAQDIIIQDLPGIYSLSPYTPEEVVARDYLVKERPDAILNIVDATNLERNLYLTTQLAELGIPMVIALNMSDLTRKNGDQIDLAKLSGALGCEVVEISALRREGSMEAANRAVCAARSPRKEPPRIFSGSVEHTLAYIEQLILRHWEETDRHAQRTPAKRLSLWYAVKLFERDEKAIEEIKLPQSVRADVEKRIRSCEAERNDDAESILTDQRYAYISGLVSRCVKKGRPKDSLSLSDRIDRVVTNRWAALPIFFAVMWFVYSISVTSIGGILTDFTNDVFVAEWIQSPTMSWLESVGCADWLVGLIGNGVIGGVGSVIGFVPQMLVLFLMLALLEDVGYMARVAFIMDRVFRKFGLSGKSFIPMLISSGCGVPGVIASRTIEQDRDRRMTIMTTTFIPCGAKMPIIGLIAGALFENAGWVAASAYFIGVAAVVVSGILLKKTRPFAGEPAPFVMELPAYHAPSAKNVLHSMWERGWSFIKRAGTVILLSSILIWFASGYGWTLRQEETPATANVQTVESAKQSSATFGAVEDMDESILGKIGGVAAPMFSPLGFGNWQSTVATVMGLVAKEQVVSVFGVLHGVVDEQGEDAASVLLEEGNTENITSGLSPIAAAFEQSGNGHGKLAAFSFLLFNLLCAPCFAAMGAIRREMNSGRWTMFAIAYQCGFAYAVALTVYQLGLLLSGAGFTLGTAAALTVLAALLYLVIRKNPYDGNHLTQKMRVGA